MKSFTFTFFALTILFSAQAAFASDITVNPPLFDLEVMPRDVIVKDVTLTNQTDRKIDVFATVNEIAVQEDGSIKEFVSPVMTDQTNTVTSWIEVTRGVIELEPRGTKTIPVTLRVHPYAAAGTYHAFVGFVPASNRPEAEARAVAGGAGGVVLKAVMTEKRDELLRISDFSINRIIVLGKHKDIQVEVQNNGDTASIVDGEIIFYNSRGEEVGSVSVNDEAVSIAPKETKIFVLQVPFSDKLGRFKANVTLDYGEGKKSSLFDTAHFFMIPTGALIMIIIMIVVLSAALTYLLRRSFYVELHDDEEGSQLPLYVRNDRDHETKDHDIHLTKGK